MDVKVKQIVWLLLFMGFIVPFVFQTTLYPFFRFGMFAEPVRYDIQDERFVLVKTSSSGKAEPYVPENIGIGKNKLDYLLRNYYYRDETQQMLEHLQILLPDSVLVNPVRIVRIVGEDTLIVGEIVKP